MWRSLSCATAVLGVSLVAHTLAQSQVAAPVVEVNGPHIVLNSSADREWRGATVELNGYWTYTVGVVPMKRLLCIDISAFVPVSRVRAPGTDYRGIHFDASTTPVKSVTLATADGRSVSLYLTTGSSKPLTTQEETLCVGAAKP